MDETTEDRFHEIQLSGKQLVFLVMAATVALIFTFLVGVRVGRDAGTKRGDEPIDSPAVVAQPLPSGETAPTVPPATEPPSPPAEDELTYHQRLQSNAAAAEKKPQPKAEQPKAEQPKAEQPKADTTKAETPAKAATPTPARTNVPTSGRPGTWVIQVIALKDRAAAAALVQRLSGKGYPAFLENPAAGAPVIYRVRVGRYKDRREAEQVARRLEKEEQFPSVITR